MLGSHVIVAGGDTYPIRFGQSALFLLEGMLTELEGKSIASGHPPKTTEVRISRGKGQEPRIVQAPVVGLELLQFLPNATAMHVMCWAGMESARIKIGVRPTPYTMHEVGDIIDAAGGIEEITLPVMKCYAEAFPKKMTPEYIAMLEAVEKEKREGKDPKAEGDAGTAGKSGSSKRSRRG